MENKTPTAVPSEIAQTALRTPDFLRAALDREDNEYICDEVTLGHVAENLKTGKGIQKNMIAARRSATSPLDESKKRIMDWFRVPLDDLARAEAADKRAIANWHEKQSRIAREEAEKSARAEEARIRKNAEARAKRAEKKGDEELAEEIRDEAQDTAVYVAPVPQPVAPSGSGISSREVWHGEVTDLKALVAAVAAGKAPITMLQANTKVVGQMARALKGAQDYPGVRFWSTKQIASRSA